VAKGINRFFTETLGVKIQNPRWSWGAIDEKSNRVFLRIWKDQIRPDRTGQKVQVYWTKRRNNSNGYKERLEHLQLVRKGAKGFGIMTQAVDPKTEAARKIASFNADALFELGELSEDDNGAYAQIVRPIPTNQIIATRPISRSSIPTQKDLSQYQRAVLEGTLGAMTCKVRRRCEELRRRARRFYRGADGKLRCVVCGWYKPNHSISGDIVELHHLRPLANHPTAGVQQLLDEAIKSMAPLCPCCHRIAHSRLGNIRRPFSVDELRAIVPKYPFCPPAA
jgi:predicted HNH restriction endonuclease